MGNKRILITGGTGFIGANLVRRLVDFNYRPVLFIRKNSNLWRLKEIRHKVTFVETNLQDYNQLLKNIVKIKPSFIFHLATYGAFQTKQTNILETYKTNIIGTVNLLQACSSVGFEYFINTSSSSEYGIKTKPIHENDKISPVNFYGVTKVAATLTASMYAMKFNLPIVTMRLFSPYGYFDAKNRFVSTLIINAIRNRKIELSNPLYVRDFIFIDDVVDAYMCFLNGKKYFGDVFNIGSGRQYTLKTIVNIIESFLNKKINLEWSTHKSNQPEPKKWQAAIGRAKLKLKWKPKTPINKGLKKTYNWFLNNRNLYK